MSNEISGLNGASPAIDAGGGARRAPETASSPSSESSAAASSAGSDVHITDAASLLAGLVQHVRTLAPVDSARVAHFQAAIDNGSYAVQPDLVASHLMQLEQSLAQIGGG